MRILCKKEYKSSSFINVDYFEICYLNQPLLAFFHAGVFGKQKTRGLWSDSKQTVKEKELFRRVNLVHQGLYSILMNKRLESFSLHSICVYTYFKKGWPGAIVNSMTERNCGPSKSPNIIYYVMKLKF